MNKAEALLSVYPETGAGGFTRYDGSIQFYGRINALLKPEMTVLDLGAGRGRQFDDELVFRKDLVRLQGKVASVTGLDVDPAVLDNPHVDEAMVYDGARMPFEDAAFDMIVSDWVLEHILDAPLFASEAERILRPGGWFCARTPNSFSIVAMASRMVPNRLHARLLQSVQKGARKVEDVFPTAYRLNSLRSVRRHFPAARWRHHSYTYSAEPSYHFNRPWVMRLVAALQYLKKPLGGENLFVFVQKR